MFKEIGKAAVNKGVLRFPADVKRPHKTLPQQYFVDMQESIK